MALTEKDKAWLKATLEELIAKAINIGSPEYVVAQLGGYDGGLNTDFGDYEQGKRKAKRRIGF